MQPDPVDDPVDDPVAVLRVSAALHRGLRIQAAALRISLREVSERAVREWLAGQPAAVDVLAERGN